MPFGVKSHRDAGFSFLSCIYSFYVTNAFRREVPSGHAAFVTLMGR